MCCVGDDSEFAFRWRAIPPSPPYTMCVSSEYIFQLQEGFPFSILTFLFVCGSRPTVTPPSTWRQSPLGSRPSLVLSHWSLKAYFSMIFPPFLATLVGTQNEKRQSYSRAKEPSSDCQMDHHHQDNEGLLCDGTAFKKRVVWLGDYFLFMEDISLQEKCPGFTCRPLNFSCMVPSVERWTRCKGLNFPQEKKTRPRDLRAPSSLLLSCQDCK